MQVYPSYFFFHMKSIIHFLPYETVVSWQWACVLVIAPYVWVKVFWTRIKATQIYSVCF